MQFTINTQEFQRLVNRCFPVVAKKATIPILANILLEAANDEVILTATDLTVSMRCFGEAKVKEGGKVALPARKLASLVRELSADQLTISVSEDNRIDLISGTSRFRLHGMNAEEFPSLPDLSASKRVILPFSDLSSVFASTSFAISRNEERYVLTGLFMEISEGKALFTATDGKRIARASMLLPTEENFEGAYIIPLKAVEDIIKSHQTEKEMTLYLMEDKMGFETENCLVITKLIAGSYPDVSRVLPDTFAISCPLHKEELQQMLKQVILFTPEETSSVHFSFSKGDLKLSANASAVGEGEVNMPINYDGEHMEVSINGTHFLDYLNHTQTEIVQMQLLDSYNPVVISESKIKQTHLEEQYPPAIEAYHVLIPMANR
jgi:DNA polymerase III subunit beta